MRLSKQIGIDLGTSTILVHVRGEGVVIFEPALAALNQDGSRILAVGATALEMVGRTPETMQVVRPLRDGVIADFVVTEALLHHYISRIQGRRRLFKPEIMLCVPSGVTSVERRAVIEAVMSAGARQAWLIDETLAAAIGAGLKIAEPRGQAVCDIGGGTTEIAVISLSGLVVSGSVRSGGNRIDEAIVQHLRRRHNLIVGDRSAEGVKIAAGAAVREETELSATVSGRDALSGLPRRLTVGSHELVDAIAEPLADIVRGVRDVLEQTPPELAADIFERGLMLTGGGALLRGLDRYVSMHTGLPVLVAEQAQTCVVRGTGLALEEFEVLRRNQRYLR